MLVAKTLALREDQVRDIKRRGKRAGRSQSQIIRDLIELGRKTAGSESAYSMSFCRSKPARP